MKTVLNLLLFSIFFSAYSQTSSEKLNDNNTIIRKVYNKGQFGELTQNNLKLLQKYLSGLSKTELDSTKIIVINYYAGQTYPEDSKQKSQAYIYQRKYLRDLKRAGNIQQYFIHKPLKNLDYVHGDRINWLADEKLLVERAFFSEYFDFGSFVVISPNGRYFTHMGEYSPNQVYEGLKKLQADEE